MMGGGVSGGFVEYLGFFWVFLKVCFCIILVKELFGILETSFSCIDL